ncbi:MAG TPA: SCO family protein [Mesorhizobium sp.]
MTRWSRVSGLLLLSVLLAPKAAGALERPSFDPQIGAQLDIGKAFHDASGQTSRLSEILDGRPALVIFGYDKCPNLCGVTQQAVASDLAKTGLDPETYRALFISIDPSETSQDATLAKTEVASSAGQKGLMAWRFLTSADNAGAALAAEAGITFDRRDRVAQYIHPIAVMAVTPQGRIAQVLPALSFEPRDLRLALVEASAGRLGSIADHVFLLCAGFDASKGQYTSIIAATVKTGGVATILALAAGIFMLARRRRT